MFIVSQPVISRIAAWKLEVFDEVKDKVDQYQSVSIYTWKSYFAFGNMSISILRDEYRSSLEPDNRIEHIIIHNYFGKCHDMRILE